MLLLRDRTKRFLFFLFLLSFHKVDCSCKCRQYEGLNKWKEAQRTKLVVSMTEILKNSGEGEKEAKQLAKGLLKTLQDPSRGHISPARREALIVASLRERGKDPYAKEYPVATRLMQATRASFPYL